VLKSRADFCPSTLTPTKGIVDVHCTTCQEPWDAHHLWHDAIFETGLAQAEAEAWRDLPRIEKLSDGYRAEFKSAGWEFGASVINVIRCPSCPTHARPNLERLATKQALEELMGDDEDGLAAAYEDYRL
jgi:hypothetical protein